MTRLAYFNAAIALAIACVVAACGDNIEPNDDVDPVCGDGRVTTGEACDDGNTADGDGCRANCTEELCGDGTLDPQEECEDGNTVAGDGCDADCNEEFDCAAEGGTVSGAGCYFLATAATNCLDHCAGQGLGYDEAATVALGSGGDDLSCQTVLAALGFATGPVTGAGCDRGLGCWADLLVPPLPVGQGQRCTEPGTEGDAAPGTGDQRVCGCTEAQD